MNQPIAAIAVISEYTSRFTFAFIPYKNVNIKRESFLNWVLVNVLGVVKETILVHDSTVFWSVAPCLQNDESFATKSRHCNERNYGNHIIQTY